VSTYFSNAVTQHCSVSDTPPSEFPGIGILPVTNSVPPLPVYHNILNVDYSGVKIVVKPLDK